MFAALAVARWLEATTGVIIKTLVRTLRRHCAIDIQAGDAIVTAETPIPGDTQARLDAVHDARRRHWMSRVGELCARSTREVRSAAPGPYGGTSPNGCCFGFCPSSMIYVREREVYPNAPIVLMAVDVAFRARRAVAAPASVERVGPRCPLSPPGPLFKLDIDSFWHAADEVPEFGVDLILNQADALHEPVRYVFESLITDRFREEVLRRG